jgi:hypothetical protein
MSNCITTSLNFRIRVDTRPDFVMQIRVFLTFFLNVSTNTDTPDGSKTLFTCYKEVRIEFCQYYVPYNRSRVRFPTVSLEFFIDVILPAALWPWGWLSLQQKWVPGIFPGGKGGLCLGLTTLPPSYADCLEIWEPQTPGTLRVCPDLQWDCFTFTFTFLICDSDTRGT